MRHETLLKGIVAALFGNSAYFIAGLGQQLNEVLISSHLTGCLTFGIAHIFLFPQPWSSIHS
jgi:hypothetical protein